MKKLNKIIDDNYLYIRASLMTFIFVYTILKAMEIDFSDLFALGLVLCISISIKVLKKINKKYLGIIIVLLIFLCAIIFGFNAIVQVITVIANSFLWVIKYIKDGTKGAYIYYLVDTIVIGTLFFLLLSYLQKYSKAVLFLDGLIVISMIISTIYNINWSHFAVGISIFIVFESLVQFFQRKINKSYKGTYLFPFIIITVITVSIIPTNEEPIKWEFVKKALAVASEKISDITYELSRSSNEDMATTGFSEGNSNFFSKISDGNSSTILKLKPDSTMVNRVYLSGIVRDEYLGDGFSDTITYMPSCKDEYRMDLLEKLYNLKLSDLQGGKDNFCKRITFYISYYNLKTNRVFVPDNLNKITLTDISLDVASKGFNNYFSRRLKRNDVYSATTAVMNMNNPELLKYLRQLDDFSYKDVPDMEEVVINESEKEDSVTGEKIYNSEIINYDDSDKSLFNECYHELCLNREDLALITSKDFKNILCERSKEINDNYTKLPEDLPKEINDLSVEITKNKDNNYDKVMAINDYLKDFSYTKEPGTIDNNQDVVYSFLFDKKEGYCSYFAAATTVMCRSIGIPARYVEGVAVNLDSNNVGWTLANNDSSHAWSEIYLEGFGWIRIDSTPGYDGEELDWNKSHDDAIHRSKEEAETYDYNDDENTLEKAKNSIVKIISWWQYVVVLLVFLLAMALVCFIAFYFKNLYIYKKANNNEKVKINIKKIFKKLKVRGYGILEDETLNTYKDRLSTFEEFNDKKDIIKIIKWFEKVRYSYYTVSDNEVKWTEKVLKIKITPKEKVSFISRIKLKIKK